MKMNTEKVVQIVGLAGTILGVGATLLSNWSDSQKQDALIEKKVSEILEKKLSENK